MEDDNAIENPEKREAFLVVRINQDDATLSIDSDILDASVIYLIVSERFAKSRPQIRYGITLAIVFRRHLRDTVLDGQILFVAGHNPEADHQYHAREKQIDRGRANG